MSAIELRNGLKQVHSALYNAIDLHSKMIDAQVRVAEASAAYRDCLLKYHRESLTRSSSRMAATAAGARPQKKPPRASREGEDNNNDENDQGDDSSQPSREATAAAAVLMEAVVLAWRTAVAVETEALREQGQLLDTTWAKLKTIPKQLFGAQHAGAIAEQFWRQFAHMELRSAAARLQAFSLAAGKAARVKGPAWSSSSSSLAVAATTTATDREAPAGQNSTVS